MQNLRVQKYGGSSLADLDKIKSIARLISTDYKKGDRFLIVVSAMGKTTDELKTMAKEITDSPTQRELDMLLSAGERISMALLSMTLNDLGVPAISFTGSQAGIMTCGTFGDADILEVKPIRVEEELKNDRVVVIAGFQGVDPETKEITTLGRGGSDTTAIAMASYFGCKKCEFKKDTEGLFDKDPHTNSDAKHHPKLSWEEVLEATQNGAPYLHFKAAKMALDKKVILEFSHAHNGSSQQTTVGHLQN